MLLLPHHRILGRFHAPVTLDSSEMLDHSKFPEDCPDRPQTEPLHLSGVWRMRTTDQADALLAGTSPGFVYRRDGHPNATSLATSLKLRHGCDEALVTAQGMSAISIAALALLKPGDRVLLGQPLYGRTSFLFKRDLSRWGIECQDVVATDLAQWHEALRQPARMIVVETITNPRLSVPDLQAIASMAHQCHGPASAEHGAVVLVDNTFATPELCQPISLGADLVMESLSKFVCGHADAMLGFLGGRKPVWDRMRQTMVSFGMTSSPLDCWLTHRGLASLSVRMSHAAAAAASLARQLEGQPSIKQLDYPGLDSHPDHQVAKKQFGARFGNMLTFTLRGGSHSANRFIQSVSNVIPFCPSLGEAQTTLSHPCSTSHRSFSEEELQALGIDGGTIRLSVGLEDKELLAGTLLKGLRECE
jgi:cystathionine beta-lyase/cystathionine gamma-synthase